MPGVSLVPIDRDGSPRGFTGPLPEVATQVIASTLALYESVGFDEPWIGYLAIASAMAVGTCGFKSAPVGGRVEIAYFTFDGFEGQGLATAMAAELIALARRADPDVVLAAQTLLERNASHRVLEKFGFRCITVVNHPEDGRVLEWQLPPDHGD